MYLYTKLRALSFLTYSLAPQGQATNLVSNRITSFLGHFLETFLTNAGILKYSNFYKY